MSTLLCKISTTGHCERMGDSKSQLDALLAKAAEKLDYFNTKPLAHYNPSAVNEYFKNDFKKKPPKQGNEMSSLASSKRSVKTKKKKEEEVLVLHITEASQKLLIRNIGDYIRFYCNVTKKKVSLKEVEALFRNPAFTDFENETSKYAKELMVSFDFMFKTARLRPASWFNILMDWKGTGNQVMLLSEFGMGMHQLSEELKLPLWESSDIYKLFDYISNYRYCNDGSPQNPAAHQTSASIQARSQNRANQTISKVDLSVAFKKYKLSNRKIEWLNNTANVVSKLNEYLSQGDISLRSFLLHTIENETVKKISLNELDTILSILITDFNSACNSKLTHATNNNYNNDNYNRNMGDNDLFSGVSDLSQSSHTQPGFMKFGIPKRKTDNSAMYG